MNENMNADMNMAAAAVEIRGLHAFFVTWFTGRDENSETVFRANFDARFADGFQLVEPSGRLLGLGDLRGGVLGLLPIMLPKPPMSFLSAGFKIWKEHMRFSSTVIIAPALSNSPQ